MGRGNVCVTGPYEGLYYIDNDHYHVYRRDDPYAEYPETRLIGELDYDELTGDDWLYDEWGTAEEEDDIMECFAEDFTKMFPSFERCGSDTWLKTGAYGRYERRVLLENKLFYIALEDNEWSLAVELIQKEAPWPEDYSGLQSRHYNRYLDGIKKCLLNRLPSISFRRGPWMCGTITRDEVGQ